MVDSMATMLADGGVPAPRATAWMVALIELVGGALLLPGLFTRLWSLGMVCIMCGAIALTTWPVLMKHPFVIGMPQADATTFIIQITALFVSFGLLLTGGGGASIDRVVFGRSGADDSTRPARASGGGTAS